MQRNDIVRALRVAAFAFAVFNVGYLSGVSSVFVWGGTIGRAFVGIGYRAQRAAEPVRIVMPNPADDEAIQGLVNNMVENRVTDAVERLLPTPRKATPPPDPAAKIPGKRP